MKFNTCFEEIKHKVICLIFKKESTSENKIEHCQRENKIISLNVLLLKIKFFALFHSSDDNQRKAPRKFSNLAIFEFYE
jgi:hypothetical protein